jgi:hypothetical protein
MAPNFGCARNQSAVPRWSLEISASEPLYASKPATGADSDDKTRHKAKASLQNNPRRCFNRFDIG